MVQATNPIILLDLKVDFEDRGPMSLSKSYIPHQVTLWMEGSCLFLVDHIYVWVLWTWQGDITDQSPSPSYPKPPLLLSAAGRWQWQRNAAAFLPWGKVNLNSLRGFHPPLGNFMKGENFTSCGFRGLLFLNRNFRSYGVQKLEHR